MAQVAAQDSVWAPIHSKSETLTKKKSKLVYAPLFDINYFAPQFEKDSVETIHLKAVGQPFLDLLKQAKLEDSYAPAEIKGTGVEKYLRDFEQMSFPFAFIITSELANAINLPNNNPKLVSYEGKLHHLGDLNEAIVDTKTMLKEIVKDEYHQLDAKSYLRKRLLDLVVGSYNETIEDLQWTIEERDSVKVYHPYINQYNNQYMRFDGSYKLFARLIAVYSHFENYDGRIKNLKKVTKPTLGFDVNMLSSLNWDAWEAEVNYMQEHLNTAVINTIIQKLPESLDKDIVTTLLEELQERIDHLPAIAKEYYALVAPNRVVRATGKNNLIVIDRGETTTISVYNEKTGKSKRIAHYSFKANDTESIWLYGLNGNDYIEVGGKSNAKIPLTLIGGKHMDKYEIQHGKGVAIFDSEKQNFVVDKNSAKVRFLPNEYIVKYNPEKYSHTSYKVKPRIGANPEDELFIGVSNELLVNRFERDPYTQKHIVSAAFYLGNSGFDASYYGEKVNVFKDINAFVSLAYQSPNYSTNFFGFGNDTSRPSENFKLQYHMVKIASFDVQLGGLVHREHYDAKAALFFESRKIDPTPDRFVSSTTLFSPPENFFKRKNYAGLQGRLNWKIEETPLVEDLEIDPSIAIKGSVNIGNVKASIVKVNPQLKVVYPILEDKVSFDATLDYAHIFGKPFEFYQAAYLGGNNGLRGYRRARFTGRSSVYSSSNIQWHVKDFKSEVLPLQFRMLGGFDAGRVWMDGEDSNTIHTAYGAGFSIQTANLLKGQMLVFGGAEGVRFSFNLFFGF